MEARIKTALYRDEYQLIPLMGVILVGSLLGTLIRLQIYAQTQELGTANLFFAISLLFSLFVYRLIGEFLVQLFLIFSKSKKKSVRDMVFIETVSEPAEVIDIEFINPEPQKNELSREEELVAIREIKEINKEQELVAKIEVLRKYITRVFAEFFDYSTIRKIEEYVVLYARNHELPKIENKIKLNLKLEIRNVHLLHFGWNMTNFLGKPKKEVSHWVYNVFELIDITSPVTVEKKMKQKPNTKIIPIIKNIPEYLAKKEEKKD